MKIINIRENERNRKLARKYNLKATPMLVFFDENGKHIFDKVGVMSEKEIVEAFSLYKIELVLR